LERLLIGPHRVRGVELRALFGGAAQEVEALEARHLRQERLPLAPGALEVGGGLGFDAKVVHSDVHAGVVEGRPRRRKSLHSPLYSSVARLRISGWNSLSSCTMRVPSSISMVRVSSTKPPASRSMAPGGVQRSTQVW